MAKVKPATWSENWCVKHDGMYAVRSKDRDSLWVWSEKPKWTTKDLALDIKSLLKEFRRRHPGGIGFWEYKDVKIVYRKVSDE